MPPSSSGPIDPRAETGDDELRSQEGKCLALYDTVRERDVDLVHDVFVPGPVKGSKGVRVMVL